MSEPTERSFGNIAKNKTRHSWNVGCHGTQRQDVKNAPGENRQSSDLKTPKNTKPHTVSGERKIKKNTAKKQRITTALIAKKPMKQKEKGDWKEESPTRFSH